jgi:cell fate regulator YaaT (PSP1 superfamily)
MVSVCFRPAGKPDEFDAGDIDIQPGDRVVCRTTRGLEIGTVRSFPSGQLEAERREQSRPVLRKATEDDLRRDAENDAREAEALAVAAEKVAEHGLPMKLIEAEATLDGSRIVIHFGAEGRVDFRALVRDLARALRARVELHQIGVRDEAKMRGGLGHCGRQLCCATFLTSFDPVGIKMAKEQDLSLSPQKISGVCGRLMCCLSFEYDYYRSSRQGIPKVGSRVQTAEGPGRIRDINVPRDRVVVALDSGGQAEFAMTECVRRKLLSQADAEPGAPAESRGKKKRDEPSRRG